MEQIYIFNFVNSPRKNWFENPNISNNNSVCNTHLRKKEEIDLLNNKNTVTSVYNWVSKAR